MSWKEFTVIVYIVLRLSGPWMLDGTHLCNQVSRRCVMSCAFACWLVDLIPASISLMTISLLSFPISSWVNFGKLKFYMKWLVSFVFKCIGIKMLIKFSYYCFNILSTVWVILHLIVLLTVYLCLLSFFPKFSVLFIFFKQPSFHCIFFWFVNAFTGWTYKGYVTLNSLFNQ